MTTAPQPPQPIGKPPTSGTYTKLVLLLAMDPASPVLEGRWKLVGGSADSVYPPGFMEIETGDFVPMSSVAMAER